MAVNSIGQCPCGETTFTISDKPLLRIICHCKNCQAFNNAAFADITIFRRSTTQLPTNHSVEFASYQKAMAVQRGKCTACGKPAIEFFESRLMPKLTMVPSDNLPAELRPRAALHMFYHRRQADAADALPKYSGFVRSQLGLSRHLLPALLR